ncbi:hypothetical protein BBJ28_00019111 [Nothophytophthora sp. Chile5]|nr:hypothetical protein BBJ28_00019111 [Nothophytophthora sp. Chile5]
MVLDRDCECESPLPTPPVSGAATVEGEKRPRKKRRQDRNRPGHEIARLKVQAIEMERQVEKLLAAADGSTHHRLRSCKDNRGLKTHLQWSLEHTAAFERILSSQADRALQALPNTLPVSGRNLMYEPIRDDAVFQVLARAVDRQYKETSRVHVTVGYVDKLRGGTNIPRNPEGNPQSVIDTAATMDDERDACSPRLHDALAAFLAHAEGASACAPPRSTSLLSLLGRQTGGEVDGKHDDADATSSPDDSECETPSTIPLGKPRETVTRVSAAGKGAKRPKKRRRDRNRPHHEIARLQSQASELECELQKLLATCDDRARRSLRPHTENTQLKEKLRRNLERTTRIERLLNSQTDQLLQPISGSLVVKSRNLVYDAEQDASIFQMQAQAVDAHYREMDRVLAVAGLLGVTSEGLTLGSASRIVVQKREVTLGDTVCIVRLVLKQFIEKDRFVHVWDTVGEWPQVGTACHVSTRDHGWGFIQRMEDTGVSICQSCVLMTPTTEDGKSSESSEAIDAVTRLYQSMILSQHQFLENKLMDQALGIRKEKHAVA